jgi:hypothetical protein
MNGAAALPLAEPTEKRSWFGRTQPYVAFPDLVLAHFLRQQELYEGGAPGDAERRYRRYLDAFERAHGEIVDVYWSSNEISGVALTLKRPPALLRPFGGDRLWIHRVSDWATRREPDLAKALHDCETLAVRTGTVLRDTPKRVAMHWVYSLMAYLLGVVDSADGNVTADDRRRAIGAYDDEAKRIQTYYRETAVRGAQIVYFWGMMIGAGVMGLIGLAAAPFLSEFGATADDLKAFYACYVAGGTGAIVSVIQRVTSGHFAIDFELGRGAIRRLGSFRPFLGAVFGLVIFFVIRSGVIQVSEPDGRKGFYFLVVLAFIAGFSERFAKDVLDEAAGTVAPADAPATEPGGTVPPIPGAEHEERERRPEPVLVPQQEGHVDDSGAQPEPASEGEAARAGRTEEMAAREKMPTGNV